jgi:type II secretory pathway pseudopilin PulG
MFFKPLTTRVNSGRRHAFSILEIVLAMGLFAIIVGGAVSVVTRAFSSIRLGEEETKATFGLLRE